MRRRAASFFLLSFVIVAPSAFAGPPRPPPRPPPLPDVPAVDLARLKPEDFSDDDLDLPYYLAHFPTIANSVDSTGPTRGYIRYPLAYAEVDGENTRAMENVLSLAWFYTASRPWNPYRGHPAL